jgi:chromosome partitioning protein
MHTICLLSQKGGSGKTTLALSIATAAEKNGQQVLIIDLDPQATACKWSDRRKLDSPIVLDAQPARLAKALDKAREGGIDLVVIDTPPRSAEAALAAAKLADLIILPSRPQMYDLETLPNTLELISTANSGRSKPIPMMAVLNAVPSQGNRHEQARAAIEGLGIPVCQHTIGHRAAFGDAGTLGMSVLELDGSGRSSEEIRQVYLSILRLLGSEPSEKTSKPSSRKTRPVTDAH